MGETLGLTPGEAPGDATGLGEATGDGDTAGLGDAAGLFGTSGFVSQAPKTAIVAARTVVKTNGLFIFYLK